MRASLLAAFAALALAFAIVPSAGAAVSARLEPVVKGLRQPLDVRAAPDGSDRLFGVEKGGIIRVAHGLWIGWGDGGSGGDPRRNGQNGGAWLGKMLRIDVDNGSPYSVPPDNPFVGSPDTLPEIWGFGLRNPWRYSFDAATSDLWLGDVGQGTWEEIDVVGAGSPGGVNFGWNVAEGNHCFNSRNCDLSPFVPAVAEYDHHAGDCAVVGGFVYRGAAYPSLQGVYFYADECTGRLWSLAQDGAGNWSSTELMTTGISISSFGEDQDHELYLTGLNDGTVYRLAAAE